MITFLASMLAVYVLVFGLILKANRVFFTLMLIGLIIWGSIIYWIFG